MTAQMLVDQIRGKDFSGQPALDMGVCIARIEQYAAEQLRAAREENADLRKVLHAAQKTVHKLSKGHEAYAFEVCNEMSCRKYREYIAAAAGRLRAAVPAVEKGGEKG